MHIYLVRHGESVGNATGLIQGQLDLPLTDRGEAQARLAGGYLAREIGYIDAIYSSDLSRASRTAELIAGAFVTPPPCSEHPAIREMHAGTLEGMSWSDIETTHPEFYGRPLHDWLNYSRWQGATQEEHFGTVHAWMDRLTAERDLAGEGTLLIVSHAVTLRALIGWCIDDRPGHQMRYHFGNCTVVRCTVARRLHALRRSLDAFLPIEVQAAVLGRPLP